MIFRSKRLNLIRGFCASAAIFLLPQTSFAQLQWGASGGGGSGTWDGSTADWYNGSTATTWNSTIASFGGTAGTVTMNSSLSAAGLVFTTSGYILSGTGTLTLTGTPSLSINVSSGTSATETINFNLSSASAVTFNANSGSTVTAIGYVLGGTNTWGGQVSFLSGSALTSGNAATAVTYTLNGANTFNSGLTLSGENLTLTLGNANSITGTGAITIATSGTVLTVPKPTSGVLHSTIANNLVLNPNNLSSFQIAFGATKPSAAASSFATNDALIISGNISGSGDVYITNSLTAGGGAGEVLLSGNNTYTGKTVIDLTGTSGALLLGSSTALPSTTALVFGNFVSSTNGIAPLDLNGNSVTIASLATNTSNGAVIGAATGITNSQSSVVTLTINGSASTTFGGLIGLVNSGTSGVVVGTNNIALNLASGNTGTLILTKANTYTGGTTISGGVLQLGIANAVPSAGGLTLNGGTLSSGATAGFSDNLGALTVSAASTIALGTGSHTLTFTTVTGSGALSITGWTGSAGSSGTSGELIFTGYSSASSANSSLSTFLSSVAFSGFTTGGTFITNGSNVELVPVTPVPEPVSVLLAGGSLLGALGCFRRRKLLKASN